MSHAPFVVRIERRKVQSMKRTLTALCLCLALLFSGAVTAYASGSGNVDGGGGSLNHGTQAYNWPGSTWQGVRITVVDAETGMIVGGPVDFTNKNLSAVAGTMFHFGKVSKMQYRDGAALTLQLTGYTYYTPATTMPQIISSNSSQASIAAIKRYFCSEGAASMVAECIGMDLEELTSGSYKLVIEPVIYLIYNNLYYAMTTTEAGLYNRMLGGDLGAHFPTVVMKNLALALFLENSDLGFPAWGGSRTTARTTDEIINVLGIGIISYNGAPETNISFNTEYRIDTDVITSVTLSTSAEINNDDTARVTFSINGSSYHMDGVVLPKNGSQLVWVKWHTPSYPCEITIHISTDKGTLSNTAIHANVVDLNQNPPPDPQADDRNDRYVLPSVPSAHDVTSLSWGQWSCAWHPNWVWVPDWKWESGEHSSSCPDGCTSSHGSWVDRGEYEDQGWYDYTWHPYSASLSAALTVSPDEKNPTRAGKTMKSGYGIAMDASGQIVSGAPASHITGVQTCVAYFPEFEYDNYWRLLERTRSGYSAGFQFRNNEYSTYGRRVHFTPVWFPDGNYTVYGHIMDAWTPAGMLQVHLTDSVAVQGNLFSDWLVRPAD